MRYFGWFKGLPYETSNENFEEYRRYHNQIDKETVIKHIKSLDIWATSLPSYDFITGEKLEAGMYEDGEFRFPLEFLHFYKNYDIGIPYDYEDYLVNELKL